MGTSAAFACEVAEYDGTVRVTRDSSGCSAASPIMLIDPYGGVAIPSGYTFSADFPRFEYLAASYPPGATIPTATPTPIFEVRRATRPDCGGLEPGRHPCLVADPGGQAPLQLGYRPAGQQSAEECPAGPGQHLRWLVVLPSGMACRAVAEP